MNKVEDISWGNAGSHLEQWYLDPTSINEEVLFGFFRTELYKMYPLREQKLVKPR